MQVILVGAANVSGWGIVLAFFLFRVFDIAKPFPINRSQKLPAGYGIVIDDLLAGVYARLVLIAIGAVFPNIGFFIL